MKKFLRILLPLALVLTAGTAAAADISQPLTGGWHQIQYFQPIGQTFTAESAYLDEFGILIQDGNAMSNPGDLSVTLRFFEGNLDFSAGALMFETEVTLTQFNNWVTADLTPYLFEVGQVYTAAFYNDTSRWGVCSGGSDSYAGGAFFLNGEAVGSDATFYVTEGEGTTQPVPEPASILLLGSGLVGLAGAARKRLQK